MLRVCVIGMGPIGNRHADMYAADPLADLVGVCDVRQDRADAAAKRLSVPAFTTATKMLAALKPDVCSITTGGYEYGSDHYRADDRRPSKPAAMCSAKSRSPTISPRPRRWSPWRGEKRAATASI